MLKTKKKKYNLGKRIYNYWKDNGYPRYFTLPDEDSPLIKDERGNIVHFRTTEITVKQSNDVFVKIGSWSHNFWFSLGSWTFQGINVSFKAALKRIRGELLNDAPEMIEKYSLKEEV